MPIRLVLGLAILALAATACGGAGSSDCQLPGIPARLAGTPIPAQPIPVGAGVSGSYSVTLTVSLDASGKVTGVAIATSSGNSQIDQAAVAVARSSTYDPSVAGCGPAPLNSVSLTIAYH